MIENFPGRRSGFRVEMWGTSLPGDKLTSDFGNEPEATSAGDRGLFRLLAGNLSPGVLGLLQQNLLIPDSCSAAKVPLFDRLSAAPSRSAQQGRGGLLALW
jgi:hypothetical protein